MDLVWQAGEQVQTAKYDNTLQSSVLLNNSKGIHECNIQLRQSPEFVFSFVCCACEDELTGFLPLSCCCCHCAERLLNN
jgi:hypothetical protein